MSSLKEARIKELEDTVADLVSYLRRLPANPETYRKASNAEAVLLDDASSTPLEGGQYHPSGIVVIAARLDGRMLTVKTQNIDKLGEEVACSMRFGLYDVLKKGATFELKYEPVLPSRDFFME